VVIPIRDNHATIGDAIESLLDQDYPNLREIILIGGLTTRRGTSLSASMIHDCR
jgi:hypothetical protein